MKKFVLFLIIFLLGFNSFAYAQDKDENIDAVWRSIAKVKSYGTESCNFISFKSNLFCLKSGSLSRLNNDKTWTVVYDKIAAVQVLNNKLVGYLGNILYTSDSGIEWNVEKISDINIFVGLEWDGSNYIALVINNQNKKTFYKSMDLLNWSKIESSYIPNDASNFKYNGSVYLTKSYEDKNIYTSYDLINWNIQNKASNLDNVYRRIGNKFVSIDNFKIIESADGQIWKSSPLNKEGLKFINVFENNGGMIGISADMETIKLHIADADGILTDTFEYKFSYSYSHYKIISAYTEGGKPVLIYDYKGDITILSIVYESKDNLYGIDFKDDKLKERIISKLGNQYRSKPIYPDDMLKIEELNLVSSGVKNFEALKYAKNLKRLEVSGDEFDINLLSNFKGLESLTISSLNLENLSFLEELSSLSKIKITRSNVKDYSSISKLNNLTSLEIEWCNLENISFVRNLNALIFIQLNSNNLTDINDLSYVKNLKAINIMNNKLMSVKSFEKLSDLPNLERLSISYNSNEFNKSERDAFFNKVKFEVMIETKDRRISNKTTNSIQVYFNGKKLNTSVEPVIINGYTLIPARDIVEKIGAKIAWNSKNKTVVISKDSTNIKLTLDSDTAIVNNKSTKLDVSARVFDGRTFVPLRFISENLNQIVDWDGKENTVLIVDKNSSCGKHYNNLQTIDSAIKKFETNNLKEVEYNQGRNSIKVPAKSASFENLIAGKYINSIPANPFNNGFKYTIVYTNIPGTHIQSYGYPILYNEKTGMYIDKYGRELPASKLDISFIFVEAI